MRQGDVHYRHIKDDHELGAEHDGQRDPGAPGTASRRSRNPVAPAVPVDPWRTCSPMRSMRRRQDASMVVWSCDFATANDGTSMTLRRRRWNINAVEAGLR